MATRGSPGRMRRITKTLRETPSSVTTAYAARRARYFFIRNGGPRRAPHFPPTFAAPRQGRGAALSPEPHLVPSDDVVDAEVRGWVLALHLVVVGVVDLLVRDRDERRIVLEDVLRLADHLPALGVVQLALDLARDVVEGRIRPPRVVLRAVLAVPRAEDVGRIHQRGDDGADGQIEVARLRLVEPNRGLDNPQVALDVEVLLQHRLDGDRPQLEGRDVADDEVQVPQAVAVAGLLHEASGLLHGRLDVLLVAELLLELRTRRRHLVERIDEAADLHRGRVLHDLHERGAVHGQMDGPPHARVGQRLVLLHVGPEGLDDALVEGGRGHALHLLRLPPGHGVQQPRVIDPARQEGGAELRRERQEVVDLEAVDERQPLVPVVGVAVHDPDFLVLARDVLERPRPWVVHDLPEVALVLLEGLLPHDDVPAAGEGAEHVGLRPRLRHAELDRVRIDDDDLADRREQRRARDHDALRRT